VSDPEPPPLTAGQLETELLLRGAAAGGPGANEAVEKLLALHHHRLMGYARRKVGVDWSGKIDAEDVLQEAYVGVFADIGAFKPQGEDSFYRWATRIIDHRFIDHVRRMRRKKRDTAREIARAAGSNSRDSLLDRCLADTTTPYRIARRGDAVAAMMVCIAQLPEHYRVVVERLYLNEEPIAKIAADLERTEDAVRRMAGRAVDQLRGGLGLGRSQKVCGDV